MAKFSIEEVTSKNVWEEFVLSKGPKSFLQSWNWGEVNKKVGSAIFRLGFKKNGKLVGVCLLIKEKAKRGPHFIIPAGPLIDWGDRKLVNLFISAVKDLAKKEGIWFIRIRPEILDSGNNRKFFKRLGFISAPMHLHAENTWVLDISKTEEQILSGMRKTTRYLVRKGEKSGLTLEISKDSKDSGLIYKLQKETIERHRFKGFSEKLFMAEIENFARDNSASVFISRKGKTPLAAAIIVFYGDTAYYHFSGSVSGFPKVPFSYFLQWEIIKEAKKRGINNYNFWGIAPNDNPRHRFAGVTLFKTGFGGQRIDWLHAQDLPISLLYWFTYCFETIRKITRGL